MTKDEALNIAIDYMNERLEEHDAKFQRHPVTEAERNNILADIETVKEALAQPEQEPVACDGDFPEGFDASLGVPAQALRVANAIMCDVIGKRDWDVPCTAQHVLSFAKKYTNPPQRKPLTDEGIEMLWPLRPTDEIVAFARAIEAAHGIKGEA